jgi:hypothetical protein
MYVKLFRIGKAAALAVTSVKPSWTHQPSPTVATAVGEAGGMQILEAVET